VLVEGGHQVTKQDVLDRLALKKGLALHQVSLSYLAERLPGSRKRRSNVCPCMNCA
jgi:hypothetical protein